MKLKMPLQRQIQEWAMMKALQKAFDIVMPKKVIPAQEAIIQRGIAPLVEKLPQLEGDITEIYGPLGVFQPMTRGPGFFSKMGEVLSTKLNPRGTGKQFLEQIEAFARKGMFKPEELEYSGLRSYLGEKAGEKLPREAVLGELGQRGTTLEEITLGGRFSGQEAKEQLADLLVKQGNSTEWEAQTIIQNWTTGGEQVARKRLGNTLVDEFFEQASISPKYRQWTMEGPKENYQETLITHPNQELQRMEKRYTQLDMEAGERPLSDAEYLEFYNLERELAENKGISQQFTSPHWEEPDVLVWARHDDRIDIEGKKNLFVEEIQSDWHQEGRKRGYGPLDTSKWTARKSRTTAGPGDPIGWWNIHDETGQRIGTIRGERAATNHEAIAAFAAERQAEGPLGVPDAPFKKTWPELAMKRMLKKAVDEGYDRVSWTPGQIQADRYNLSKYIDEIQYTQHPDGTYSIVPWKEGTGVAGTIRDHISEADLENYIGKELTVKMKGGAGSPIYKETGRPFREAIRSRGGSEWKSISGLDLQIGGEGMKSFYDRELKSVAQKLGKKYGAKVGVTKVPSGGEVVGLPGTRTAKFEEVWYLDITPAMKEEIGTKGWPLFTLAPLLMGEEGEKKQKPQELPELKYEVDLLKRK